MKISVWCIGKSKEPYVQEGLKVLSLKAKRYWDLNWEEIEVKYKSKESAPFILEAEEDVLLRRLKPKSTLILLDEQGKVHNSIGLAKEFQHLQDIQGTQELVLVIGGAYGFSPLIKQKAYALWSFSSLTFTHQMIRLILLEQLFRVGTIIKGEEYHH